MSKEIPCSSCLKQIPETQLSRLRDGKTICKSCIKSYSDRIARLKREIQRLTSRRYHINAWDAISVAVVITSIAALLHFYRGIPNSIIGVMLISGYLTLTLLLYAVTRQFSQRSNQPTNDVAQSEIDRLKSERHQVYLAMFALYQQFWDYPPDWQYRRRQVMERAGNRCEQCGRSLRKRGTHRHVHHVIPRSLPGGHHGLANLQLLCEDCHSTEESPGHARIGQKAHWSS